MYILAIWILLSCSSEKPISKIDSNLEVVLNCDFAAILNPENHILNNKIKVNIAPINGGFQLDVKKNTFFGKKVIGFYWVSNKNSKALMSKITILQNLLKAQELVGFKTMFKKIQFKDTTADVFFQEGFDKRLIESNKNREGILFAMEGKKIKVLYAPKNTSKNRIYRLKNSLVSYLDNDLELNCFFDLDKTAKFLSTLKALDLTGESSLKISYYVNPVSNLIEPVASFDLNTSSDNLASKLISDNSLQSSLSFSNEQSQNIQRYFVENNLKSPVLKVFSSSQYLQDLTSCYSKKEFFEYFEDVEGVYRLKGKKINVSKALIIPKGLNVEIINGQEVDFTDGGFLLSFSPLFINGAKFYSSDSTGRGLHLINAKEQSWVVDSEFSGLKNLEINSWKLPSAVTFYESPVEIKNTKFLNNQSEDGLNLFRSEPFLLEGCFFENTFSDAFDADFSDGVLKNCIFENLGNDAIDVSGSKIIVSSCQFRNVEDKALSSGEASLMTVDSVIIEGASLAITAKDNSTIIVSNSSILNSDVAFCAFQKKKEFGPSHIEGKNILYMNSKKDFLIEKKSTLKLNGNFIEKYEESVRKILYGNEYGKSTVK